MNPFRLLMWLFAMVFMSVLSGCDLELEDLDLDELSIAASDQFDIEAGTYTIEYTIQDRNWYSSNYDIEVVIEAFDQNDEPVEVSDDTMVVHEGDAYDVTIFVFDKATEEIVAEKTITITAVFPEALLITNDPNRIVYQEGDSFDPTGMVVALLYSNGGGKVVEDYVFKEEPLTVEDASFSIRYGDFATEIQLEITERRTEYIIDCGEIHDPLTVFAPFLSHIPAIHIPGTSVINLYETPDFSGDPIVFPYIRTDQQSVRLYAEFDASIHRITFNVPEGFTWVDGGPLEQFVVHGEPLPNPPVLFQEGYTMLGWNDDLAVMDRDRELTFMYAVIIATKDQSTSDEHAAYFVDVISSDIPIEINLRVDDWGHDYFEHVMGTRYLIEENTTVSARAKYKGEWIELNDVIIACSNHSRPAKPTVSYYSPMDTPGSLIAVLENGTKPDESIALLSHTRYRLDHAPTWETFTGDHHVILVPNDTIIDVETYDLDLQPSSRLTISATLASFTYDIGQKTTERSVLQMTEYFPNGIKTVTTRLIGNIHPVEGTDMGTFEAFYPYTTGSHYIGCGPKAAEIFLGWFGSEKTQFDLVHDHYVETQSVNFFSGIFTTPAQLDFGISRALLEYGLYDDHVTQNSPNTTNETVNLIESYLENGFPVIILVDEGNHYQVISSSLVTWSESGSVLHAEFVLHDNGGPRIHTWSQIAYFFEDQLHAVAARTIGFISYRDMILSIEVPEEA
jgi:hypothetical protein